MDKRGSIKNASNDRDLPWILLESSRSLFLASSSESGKIARRSGVSSEARAPVCLQWSSLKRDSTADCLLLPSSRSNVFRPLPPARLVWQANLARCTFDVGHSHLSLSTSLSSPVHIISCSTQITGKPLALCPPDLSTSSTSCSSTHLHLDPQNANLDDSALLASEVRGRNMGQQYVRLSCSRWYRQQPARSPDHPGDRHSSAGVYWCAGDAS